MSIYQSETVAVLKSRLSALNLPGNQGGNQGGYPGQQVPMQQGAIMGTVPVQSVGVCRTCGVQFQRPPGASQFSDQWFRCPNCAGVASADFCCTIM